jgi:uncharacterized protein (TIGR03437 family)
VTSRHFRFFPQTGFCLLAVFGVPSSAQVISEEVYLSLMNASLDSIVARTAAGRQYPVQFSGNLFFAHEVAIAATPLSVLRNYVDGLREAGVHRIDINPGIWPWRAPASDAAAADAIAKYDAIIGYIRQSNLRIVLNPQYSTPYFQFQTFDAWIAAAEPVYVELARRYQPDIFVVAHEPSTMAARLGVAVSVEQWRSAAQRLASRVKAVAPRTRIGAGGLFNETAYYNAFLTVPEIDTMTIDIYGVGPGENYLDVYTDMIRRAHNAGRAVYIEETWRPTYYVPGPGQTLESTISAGVGDAKFQSLDQKWLTAMTQFASTLGVEAVTPFWTQPYFLYVQDGSSNALEAGYNARAGAAMVAGQRTNTQRTAQTLSGKFGIRHLTVNSANFEDGAVAPDSVATIYPYPGTIFTNTSGVGGLPLPTRLAGVAVTIRDQAGVERDASLISVVPGQISVVVPAGTALGPATVTVNGTSGASTGAVVIASVSPGIFTANQNGSGIVAAYITRNRGGVQTQELTFAQDQSGSRVAVPIDLGPSSDEVVLSLYGTGLRRGADQVAVTIGGLNAAVQFAGSQQQFPGLDQVNVPIPRSLTGRGEVPVTVLAGGKFANLVTITIR